MSRNDESYDDNTEAVCTYRQNTVNGKFLAQRLHTIGSKRRKRESIDLEDGVILMTLRGSLQTRSDEPDANTHEL